jgi:hypothetical protein
MKGGNANLGNALEEAKGMVRYLARNYRDFREARAKYNDSY